MLAWMNFMKFYEIYPKLMKHSLRIAMSSKISVIYIKIAREVLDLFKC